jgi:hypothetical protein
VDVESSEKRAPSDQRRQYERDRVAWNLPAPKTRTIAVPGPERAPVAEAETSDEPEPEPIPAA